MSLFLAPFSVHVTACMYVCDSTLDSLFLLLIFAEGNDIKNVSHVKSRPRPRLHAYTVYANTCYHMSELLMCSTVTHNYRSYIHIGTYTYALVDIHYILIFYCNSDCHIIM